MNNYKDIELTTKIFDIKGTNPIAVPIDAKEKIKYLVLKNDPIVPESQNPYINNELANVNMAVASSSTELDNNGPIIPNPAEFTTKNVIPDAPIIPETPTASEVSTINNQINNNKSSNLTVNQEPVVSFDNVSKDEQINPKNISMQTLNIPENLAALSDDELIRTLEDAKTLVEECIMPTMSVVSSELGKYILLAKEQKERQKSQIELYNKGQENIQNNFTQEDTYNPFAKAA